MFILLRIKRARLCFEFIYTYYKNLLLLPSCLKAEICFDSTVSQGGTEDGRLSSVIIIPPKFLTNLANADTVKCHQITVSTNEIYFLPFRQIFIHCVYPVC